MAIRIHSPEGQIGAAPKMPAPPVDVLAGLRIAVLDNRKPNARELLTGVAQRIAERGAAQVSLVTAKATAATPAEPEILQQLEAADVVLTGSAD